MVSRPSNVSRKWRATVRASARISAVERRLPATGLVLGKIHAVAEPLQHPGHGHPDLWKKLIDDAGNE